VLYFTYKPCEKLFIWVGIVVLTGLLTHPTMAVVTSMDAQMVLDLRNSVKECSERGLSVASKW
jgi:hypothetical protein